MTSLGVVLPLRDAGPAELLGAARLAEEAGLGSVWAYDQLHGPAGRAVLEGWSALTAAAAATRAVRVGTLVLRAGLRPPRVVAAMAASAASVAPGRLVLGLGAGDGASDAEEAAYGYPPASRAGRLQRLTALLGELRRLCPELPVWIGGRSDPVLEIAAEADGWNFWGPPQGFAPALARLRRLSGDPMPETSWAGPDPGRDGLRRLADEGADHILVAVGARTWRERIPQLLLDYTP